MKSKFLIISTFILLGVILLFTLSPVPIVSENQCKTVEGIVEDVFITQSQDIVFILEGSKKKYYINRGTEAGVQREEALAAAGKNVVIKYPEYFTLLDPNEKMRHLSRIDVEGKMLFNECKSKR